MTRPTTSPPRARVAACGPRRCAGRRAAALTLISTLALVAACAGDDATDATTDGADDAADVSSSAATTTTPGGTTPTAPGSSEPAGPTDGTQPPPSDPSATCPVDALTDAATPVEITFWHSMSATTGVELEQLIADYNRVQDRVHVTPVFQGGYAETFGKYVSTLRSDGELPTLVQLSEIFLQPMLDSETIVPIDDCVAASDFDLSGISARVLDQYRVDGELVRCRSNSRPRCSTTTATTSSPPGSTPPLPR